MIPESLISAIEKSSKVIVLGLGSEIRGDEIAPMRIIEKLDRGERLLSIWAGTRPENFTGKIIEYAPDHLLVFMVSKFGGNPGELKLVQISEHSEESLHESPLTTMTHYLKEKIDVEVSLLLIEPKNLMIGETSEEVKEVTRKIISQIKKATT